MQLRFRRLLTAALVGAVSFGVVSQAALASTTTGSIPVSATIADVCTLAVNPMAFGTYSGTALAGTTAVTVNCTLGGVATLSANAGVNGSGTSYQRNMVNPNNTGTPLPYNLYTQVGHTTVFGDGSNSSSTISITGTGANATTTLYGNIPASSVVYPGTYNDTVLVTLTY